MSDVSSRLVIGISSRALFDLEEEDRIFRNRGLDDYRTYQLEYETVPLDRGTAYPLIRGLLDLNKADGERIVEVIIISRNNPETGLRVFHAIADAGLDITKAAFIGSDPLPPVLAAFEVDLFLSREQADVQAAIDAGIPAALLYKQPLEMPEQTDKLRIAFDADAVLFSEESEAIYKERGLAAFLEHEKVNADKALPDGPLAGVLKKLGLMQAGHTPEDAPVKIAIVTARNSPAHERVIKTLRVWGVRVDAAFFLGTLSKDRILKAFGAHIFFDDQERHLAPASYSVPCALVPYRSSSVLRQRIAESAPPVDDPGEHREEQSEGDANGPPHENA